MPTANDALTDFLHKQDVVAAANKDLLVAARLVLSTVGVVHDPPEVQAIIDGLGSGLKVVQIQADEPVLTTAGIEGVVKEIAEEEKANAAKWHAAIQAAAQVILMAAGAAAGI